MLYVTIFGIAIIQRQPMSILLLAAHFTTIEGYASFCKANKTLTIPAGSSTLFEIIDHPNLLGRQFLDKTSYPYELIARCEYNPSAPTINFAYYDCVGLQNNKRRIKANAYISENGTRNINIELKDTRTSDNGTYTYANGFLVSYYCWTLYVIDLKQVPEGRINENEPVRVFGNTARSLLNATAKWLLNGLDVNQIASTLEQENALWIASVPRALNGKNVTYRLVHDDGQVNEVHLTLEINYGPDWPLTLSPQRTYYTLNSGEYLPNISCNADCNPPCQTVWRLHSNDSVLSLGHVTPNSTGEYTCVASTPRKSVTTTVYVNVIENKSQTAVGLPVVVVASFQAITCLILGICGIRYCLRTRGSACPKWGNDSVLVNGTGQQSFRSSCPGGSKSNESEQRGSAPMTKKEACPESANYEDLDETTKYVSTAHLYSRASGEICVLQERKPKPMKHRDTERVTARTIARTNDCNE